MAGHEHGQGIAGQGVADGPGGARAADGLGDLGVGHDAAGRDSHCCLKYFVLKPMDIELEGSAIFLGPAREASVKRPGDKVVFRKHWHKRFPEFDAGGQPARDRD